MSSILVDFQIKNWAENGCRPLVLNHVNPASLDLTLDNKFIDVHTGETVSLLPGKSIKLYQDTIGVQIYNVIVSILRFFRFNARRKMTTVLASTREYLYFDEQHCAEMKLKTTPCRNGLGHPIADWVDPGFEGQLTMMLYANRTYRLVPGTRICQLVIHKLDNSVETSYKITGHYVGQLGPTKAWKE